MSEQTPHIAAVVIGRNEGDRLIRCLAALQGQVARIVYVDSGSDDGSQDAARAAGAELVDLDTSLPFTAARARNAGLDHLASSGAPPDCVQFLDGDCEVQPGWMAQAVAFLQDTPEVAVVCGRRRERFPEASVYNWLADQEWNTPVGPARSCGGDALMRYGVVQQVGGYNPGLIAGEEPELCVRIRQAGWRVYRLDAEMTLHDAAMTRFGQWWQRARRAGFAYAAGAALHGAPPERHNVAETRRALIWGAGLPVAAALGAVMTTPWAGLILLAWPAQVARLTGRLGVRRAFFLTLGKIPEALGVLTCYQRRLTGARAQLIEYK